MKLSALFILYVLISAPSFSEIYKCTEPTGKSVFSDQRCSPKEKEEVTKTQPLNVIKFSEGKYEFEKANYWSEAILEVHDISSRYECAKLCESNQACKVASYHSKESGGWDKTCILRVSATNKHLNQSGIVSWVK
ncbi:MAG: PAN domain-containing protein [Bermanella sp.]